MALMVDSLIAFVGGLTVLIAALVTFLHVRMYQRGAALQRLNPTLPIRYSFLSGFQPLRMVFGDQLRKLGFKYANGWDIIAGFEPFKDSEDAMFAIVTPVHSEIRVANPEVYREIANGRVNEFAKQTAEYSALKIYGDNIVTLEGEDWKRHRRVVAAQFNEKTHEYVQQITVQTLQHLFAKWKVDMKGLSVDELEVDAQKMAFTVMLSILCDAAFGVKFDFESDGIAPPGYHLSFQRSAEILSSHLVIKLVLPDWAFKLPFKDLQTIGHGFTEFEKHARDLIANARNETKERSNLLSALVKAVDAESSSDTDPQKSLSEQELVGNLFLFMFAGHETTANIFSYAMGHLALQPEYQEKLYEETNKVIPLNELPTYKHFALLPFTMAVANETMRMHPPVHLIPKIAGTGPSGTDQFQSLLGGKYQIPVRGNASDPLLDRTDIFLFFYALHRNPKYWGPDPDSFRPERWLDRAEDESESSAQTFAFAPFSIRPRGCLGKKFASVELVYGLTMLNRYYSWRICPSMADEEVRKNGSAEEIEASARAAFVKSLNKPTSTITLRPGTLTLLFKRRTA